MKGLVLLATLVAVIAAAGATQAAPAKSPTLRLLGGQPIVLRGTGFRARESVRVTVHTGEITRSKRVVAARGTFTVSFNGVSFDRCNGLLAVARGESGRVARLKLPQPLCPPS
jgi:hypothetical protein